VRGRELSAEGLAWGGAADRMVPGLDRLSTALDTEKGRHRVRTERMVEGEASAVPARLACRLGAGGGRVRCWFGGVRRGWTWCWGGRPGTRSGTGVLACVMRRDPHGHSITGLRADTRPDGRRPGPSQRLCHAGSRCRADRWGTHCRGRGHRGRFPYIGKEKDEETGLNYHSARYYSPWLGRWASSDPAGLVEGVGRYTYVGGRPVGLRDPTGTDSEMWDMANGSKDAALDAIDGREVANSDVGTVQYATWQSYGDAGLERGVVIAIRTDEGVSLSTQTFRSKGIPDDRLEKMLDVFDERIDFVIEKGLEGHSASWSVYEWQRQQSDVLGNAVEDALWLLNAAYAAGSLGPSALRGIVNARKNIAAGVGWVRETGRAIGAGFRGALDDASKMWDDFVSGVDSLRKRYTSGGRKPATPAAPPKLAQLLDAHGPGQGFTSVFDEATGQLHMMPSRRFAAGETIPDGWVNRSGGHGPVSSALGGDASSHVGFATIIEEGGGLQLTWRSGQLNQPPSYLVPGPLRARIVEAVERATGRKVTSF